MAQLIKGKQIASQSVTVSGSTGNVIVSGDINVGNYQVNVTNYPTTSTQLANKAYVDAVAQGVTPHAPVRVVSTSDITLEGTQTIDSVGVIEGDRVLVAGQTDKTENGLFTVHSGSTAWTRTPDADGDPDNEVTLGDFVFVSSGTTNGSTGWVLGKTDSPDMPITPGVDTQEWYKMAAPGTYAADNEGITLEGVTFKLVLDGTSLSKSGSGLRISSGYTSSIETLVSSSVSTEGSTRTSADASLATGISTSVSSEASLRTSADASLTTQISTEISTRTSADASLASAITTSTSNAVSVEASIRESADASLATGISTSVSSEASLRTSADTSLATGISTSVSSEASLRTSADTSLATQISTEISTRTSADASLASAINDLNSPTIYNENITPANSGETSAVVVSTNAFVFTTGTVSENSISVHLNGIQYNFDYTQASGVVFYTSGTPTGGSPVTLYFDGTQAGFAIETTDEVNIKFTATT